MAYICYKPSGSCKHCEYYKYDREERRMACFASDSNNKAELLRELIYLKENNNVNNSKKDG